MAQVLIKNIASFIAVYEDNVSRKNEKFCFQQLSKCPVEKNLGQIRSKFHWDTGEK